MASTHHLCCDASNIKQKIVNKYSEFAESDKKLYFSAVNIQRTWRGYVVRKMIKNWNRCAALIQKYVRGWLARLHFPDILKAYHYNMSVTYYNQQATKIQALWRGYHTRNGTVSVKDILAARREIEMASEEMQRRIKELFDDLQAGLWSEKHQYLEKIIALLFNRHHLLRTKAREGIFSIHRSNHLSAVEKILQSFPLLEYMNEIRELSNGKAGSSNTPKQKNFDLNTNLKSKPYERMLLTQD